MFLFFQTEEPDSLNPLALVGRYFREDRLRRALCVSVCPGQSTGTVSDALEMAAQSEESNAAVDVGMLVPCQDARARWWAAAIAAGAHWVRGETEEATKLYHAVEAVPLDDDDDDGPVLEAVAASFDSQRAMLELIGEDSDDKEEEEEENGGGEEASKETEARGRAAVGQTLATMEVASTLLEEAVEHVMTYQQQEEQHKQQQQQRQRRPTAEAMEENAVLRVRKFSLYLING